MRGCRAQLGELQRHLTRFQAARAAVMTLSIDAPEVAAGTAAKLGLHFPLLRACLKSLCRLVQWGDERNNLSKRPD